MKKFFVVIIAVAIVLITWIIVSDYFVFKVKAVAKYSAEKILDKASDAAIDKVFNFIAAREIDAEEGQYDKSNVHRLFLNPSYIGAITRQEILWQNLRPAFKSNKNKYMGVAYASWTAGPDYFWNEYTDHAPKGLYQPMNNAWSHIMNEGKKYFAKSGNLNNFLEAKLPKIKERFSEASPETQKEMIKLLEEVASYQYQETTEKNYQTWYNYTGKFLERRRVEGGDELVDAYKKAAQKIIDSIS